MPARRKAADRDLFRQDAPRLRMFPQQRKRRAELAQRLVIPCALADAVGQHGGVVPRCRKLQSYRVCLAGADMLVPAARHHQHQRPQQRVRHRRGRGAQIYVQPSPAGERVSLKLHWGHPFRFDFRIIIISLRENVKAAVDKPRCVAYNRDEQSLPLTNMRYKNGWVVSFTADRYAV